MGLETGDLQNYGLFRSRSTPLPSSEAFPFHLSDSDENSFHKPDFLEDRNRFHTPTPTSVSYLNFLLLSPLWPGSVTFQLVALPLLSPHRRLLPRDSLASTSAGDQARKRAGTTRSRLRTRGLHTELRISRRHHRPCGIPEAPTPPVQHGVAEENHQGDGAPPEGAVRPLTTPTERWGRGWPCDFI